MKTMEFNTMAIKIYWLHEFSNLARLGIMARPRGEDWLEDETIRLKQQDVQVIVSLLEQEEIAALGLGRQSDLCSKHSLEYINFPIPDRGAPRKDKHFRNFIDRLDGEINTRNSIVIHGRMGIGRSSIIAGCLLLKAGYKKNEVIQYISRVRGLRVPDTEKQITWLKNQK
jgi:protein-tyrosine phosphatase